MADIDAYDTVTRRLAEVTGYQPPNEKGGWRCPAHTDRNPSLSVTRGDGKIAVHCHAGCSVNQIVEALHLTVNDLFDQTSNSNGHADPDRAAIERTYDYTDPAGTLLYQVVRMAPKAFRQRHPDGNGGWVWNMQGVDRTLYRLPQVIDAVRRGRRVWIVEGEKDVEALETAGETATTNPGGAGKWRREYNQHLKGARVVIVADRDDTGRRHALDVAVELGDVARTIRLVEPVHGKDAAEHLGAGYTIDDFQGDPEPRPPLEWFTAAEHAAIVDGAPPVGWLIRPIWPADGYGVVAAEMKAGKTWAALDMAVAVAAGTPWMGMWACDTPGPVIVCLGEGGQRKMLRRLRAIAAFHQVAYENLPIHVCFRVPHLTDRNHLEALTEKVTAVSPTLVIIDPLYLAARGAKASQLIEMGEHLEAVQQVAQNSGAALALIHHWNKTGTGQGAQRMTGVGGQEWGRVLLSAAVKARATDTDTGESRVTLEWDLIGDEVPETTFRTRRRVWADDPDHLDSPLHYTIEELHADDSDSIEGAENLSPALKRIHAVLLAATDWLSVREIGDRVARDDTTGTGLKRRTIQDACKKLVDKNLVASYGQGESGQPYSYRALDAHDQLGRRFGDTWPPRSVPPPAEPELEYDPEDHDDDPPF
ncbi:MAG TPA: AAA family ATPase [Acidimicrobiales bacterium]|jgi:hypothetical protein|nr:AAA family ATPase [Acidimicrobiales bacterium]